MGCADYEEKCGNTYRLDYPFVIKGMASDYRHGVLQDDLIQKQTGKGRSITFRLGADIIDELQQEAQKKEISLNVFVGQLLKRYLDWGRFEKNLDLMPVPKSMLKILMDKAVNLPLNPGVTLEACKEENMKVVTETAYSMLKDSVLFMRKTYSLWTVLSVLQEYMRVSGINADHRVEGKKHIFMIHHELGENWSLFTKELLKLIFDDLAKVKVEATVTPNMTVVEVMLL